MKVSIELQNGKEQTYEYVERIDDSNKYKVTLYGQNGVVAIIDKGELKNLLTTADEENQQ